MSITQLVKEKIKRIKKNEPFTTSQFFELGERYAVDKALSRLVEAGTVKRVRRGVFVRPKENKFVGDVLPDVSHVIQVVAKNNGEKIQIHGAEAVRRFRISTQMPTIPIFYTSGTSRTLSIGELKVKLIHTSNAKRLQYSGKKVGMALSALWYLGKESINADAIECIRRGLSQTEFEQLQTCSMPTWMRSAIKKVGICV